MFVKYFIIKINWVLHLFKHTNISKSNMPSLKTFFDSCRKCVLFNNEDVKVYIDCSSFCLIQMSI